MSFYRICPDCGANLDSGERCDCAGAEKTHEQVIEEIMSKFVLLNRDERINVLAFADALSLYRKENRK